MLERLSKEGLGALGDVWYRAGELLRAEERAEDGSAGLIRFVASTEKPASDEHIIVQNGWELDAYKRNPVFLWAHNHSPGICGGKSSAPMHPIGRSNVVEVIEDGKDPGNRLEIAVRFNEEIDPKLGGPVNPIAYLTAFQYRAGYLGMVSVGFRMLEKKPRSEFEKAHPWHADRGVVSVKTRLGEVSGVPIGADFGAFKLGRHGATTLEEAARHFLETDDGKRILDDYVREAILRAEKRDGGLFGLRKA